MSDMSWWIKALQEAKRCSLEVVSATIPLILRCIDDHFLWMGAQSSCCTHLIGSARLPPSSALTVLQFLHAHACLLKILNPCGHYRLCTAQTRKPTIMSLPNFSTSAFYNDDSTTYLPPNSPTEPTTLIYFITGNPGLIGYYTTFLQTLHEQLRKPEENSNFSVLGTSLAGFETRSSAQRPDSQRLLSLQSQIELSEDRLRTFLHRHVASLPEASLPSKVILVGHSVGAYILLELLKRQQERKRNQEEGEAEAELVGGVCLFPTVTWIAKSPSGRRLGWALKLSGVARALGALARVLTFVLPESMMLWLVGKVSGQPPKSARTTTQFLRSPGGVREAVWMAGDEMRIIEEDRWDDVLWACERTKLVFYFGESDHWVDDGLRDELIRLRSVEGREWPKMVLDQQRIPHDFCMSDSEAIANITAEWVEKIVER